MTRFVIAIGAAVTLLLTATSAWATDAQTKDDVAALSSAQKKLARKEGTARGGPRAQAALEKRRIDNLIDRLERGEPVDPAEIDRTIKRAERRF